MTMPAQQTVAGVGLRAHSLHIKLTLRRILPACVGRQANIEYTTRNKRLALDRENRREITFQ